MSDGKCKCGEDINFAINNGKCDGCIEGYIESLECDNVTLATEANNLRVRVEGLLREREELSNG